MTIPTSDDVTASWLTETLRSVGHDVTVSDVTQQQIGTGQIGKCIRYTLTFDGDAGSAPRTLVGKFASDDETSRQAGILFQNYLKEVMFYRELQRRVTIRTPTCYYAEIEGEGPVFALLLEDMHPAVQGDQITGCSAAVARAAVLELSGLHAPLWNDASILGVDWIGEPEPESIRENAERYETLLPGFLERFGADLTAGQIDILGKLAGADSPVTAGSPEPFSLVHIDYRLDNLLIDSLGDEPAVTAVDWQSITVGNPLTDVAYFLGAGLLSEERRRCEEEIVRAYYDRIVAAGVTDYGWTDCWTDYRRGVYSGFWVTVIASMLVQETERGNEMFLTMARRHSQQAIDLGSEEFLS
ncbi:MAG: aminoglycoside phosphotransferase family protein [Acidobacteriota bacterium]